MFKAQLNGALEVFICRHRHWLSVCRGDVLTHSRRDDCVLNRASCAAAH